MSLKIFQNGELPFVTEFELGFSFQMLTIIMQKTRQNENKTKQTQREREIDVAMLGEGNQKDIKNYRNLENHKAERAHKMWANKLPTAENLHALGFMFLALLLLFFHASLDTFHIIEAWATYAP
jgi:hypothetical protein